MSWLRDSLSRRGLLFFFDTDFRVLLLDSRPELAVVMALVGVVLDMAVATSTVEEALAGETS